MAATTFAHLQRMLGSSLQNAFAQLTGQGIAAQNLDLIQIVIPGDIAYNTPTVALNVDYTGTVHNPAAAPTNGTRIGVFFSNLASSATTAQFFASAFANSALLDILQNINQSGSITYWLDYLGVAHGA
jgi:hypothetical protein